MSGNLRFLNPAGLDKPPGYTPVVEMTGPGRVIYVSGQLGTSGGKLAGAPGDFRAQAVQAFENLRVALAEVGADFHHVVKMNNYLTDMGHLKTLREGGIVESRREGKFIRYRLIPGAYIESDSGKVDHLDIGCCRLEIPKSSDNAARPRRQ